MTDMVVGGGQ